jgi:hypothetical protein
LDAGGYDSSYEGDEEENKRKKRKKDWVMKENPKSEGIFLGVLDTSYKKNHKASFHFMANLFI